MRRPTSGGIVLTVACLFSMQHRTQASETGPDIRVLTDARVSSVVVVSLQIDDRIEEGTARLLMKSPVDEEFRNIFLLRRDDPSLRRDDFGLASDGTYNLIVPAYFSMTAAGPKRLFDRAGRYEFRLVYYGRSRATEPPAMLATLSFSVAEPSADDSALLNAINNERLWNSLGITTEFVERELLAEGLSAADFILLGILEDLYTQVPLRGRAGWAAVLADLSQKFPNSSFAPYMAFHAEVSSRVAQETAKRISASGQPNTHNAPKLGADTDLGDVLLAAEKRADSYIRPFILAETAVRRASLGDVDEATRLLEDGIRNVGVYALDRQIAKVRQAVNRRRELNNE